MAKDTSWQALHWDSCHLAYLDMFHLTSAFENAMQDRINVEMRENAKQSKLFQTNEKTIFQKTCTKMEKEKPMLSPSLYA
jgi:hypothetical protein